MLLLNIVKLRDRRNQNKKKVSVIESNIEVTTHDFQMETWVTEVRDPAGLEKGWGCGGKDEVQSRSSLYLCSSRNKALIAVSQV